LEILVICQQACSEFTKRKKEIVNNTARAIMQNVVLYVFLQRQITLIDTAER